MSGNGYGSAQVDMIKDMAAFDRSPPWLRAVLRQTVADWAADKTRRQFAAARAALGDVAAKRLLLREIIAVEHGDTIAFYGPSHPEAHRD